MLKKIISGGQTGADQAGLDVAMKFNIPHGGWIPKGRKTEKGPLDLMYCLTEMETGDYRERTKQNIIDSQGTVILFRGELTGGSKLTRTHARLTGRPVICLDLQQTEDFEAAIFLKSFILENRIGILNVAGPRLSRQPWIYSDVKTVLETTLYLLFLDGQKDKQLQPYVPQGSIIEKFPETMDDAVDLICSDLPLKTKTFIARQTAREIPAVYFTFLDYIRRRVGFDTENPPLFNSCARMLKTGPPTVEDAVMAILKKVKACLETDHCLRVVK